MLYPVIHVAVITRLLNSSPFLFWAYASVLANNFLLVGHPSPSQKFISFLLLTYCFAYALIGIDLFSTFNPWT
jgi:hypothetical protein